MEGRHGRIVHATKGRIRIKLDREALTPELVDDLRAALSRTPGVTSVEARPRTGSVIVGYDPSQLDADEVANILHASASVNLEAPPEPAPRAATGTVSTTAHTIHRAFHEVDVRIAGVTGGRWDLRTAVPIAFALLAVRQIVVGGVQASTAPWYVLAWYAFDSFYKLNTAPQEVTAPQPTPVDGPGG
jgi:hypothetical protein